MHITVTIGGTLVANADYAIILFETGLPSRYYLPATSVVDWRILKGARNLEVKKVTACPYKGEARWVFHGLPVSASRRSVRFLLAHRKMRALSACAERILTRRRYFDIEIDGQRWEDVVWYYLYPMGESAAIAGNFSFDVGKPGVCVQIDNYD